MTDLLRILRVSYAGDDDEELAIPIVEQGDPRFLSTDEDVPIPLPNGETIGVYAEVGLADEVADVSISIVDGERVTAMRCGRGGVLSYTTAGGWEVLFQVGTGPWES
jgi:hypothetical protein